jgi:hypothetical protein
MYFTWFKKVSNSIFYVLLEKIKATNVHKDLLKAIAPNFSINKLRYIKKNKIFECIGL